LIVILLSKPAMNYVLAVITAYNASPDGITLKARGRAITSAINVTELCRNKFLSDVAKPEVEINTEELESEGGKRSVSVISIRLKPEDKTPKKPENKFSDPQTPKHEITEIKGVGSVTAEKLKVAGYDSVIIIAKSKPKVLAEKTGLTENQAAKIIEAAKSL